MHALQALTAILFFIFAAFAAARNRIALMFVLAVAGIIAGNIRADAAELPQLSIAVMMDSDASSYYVNDDEARQAIALYIGDVDAVYTQQFGLHVVVSSIQLHAPTPDDTQPLFLLPKLDAMPHAGANVLLLLTQRDLRIGEQRFAGYSTGAPLCSGATTSVVKLAHDAFIDGLVIKHELGHAIGLPHDGSGVCAAEPINSYIMSPTAMNATVQFSQCDVGIVHAELAANSSCLAPRTAALQTVAVASTPTQSGGGGELTEWSLVAVLILLIVQTFRASEWKSEAHKLSKRIDEDGLTVQSYRAQVFDLTREAQQLRKTIARYVRDGVSAHINAKNPRDDIAIARQLGQLEAYSRAIRECAWAASREDGTVGARRCFEIRDALYNLHQEVLRTLPATYECSEGYTHPIGERCTGQCVAGK